MCRQRGFSRRISPLAWRVFIWFACQARVQGLNEDSGGRCFDQCLAKNTCSKAAVLLLLVLLEVVNCLAFQLGRDSRKLPIFINPERTGPKLHPQCCLPSRSTIIPEVILLCSQQLPSQLELILAHPIFCACDLQISIVRGTKFDLNLLCVS